MINGKKAAIFSGFADSFLSCNLEMKIDRHNIYFITLGVAG